MRLCSILAGGKPQPAFYFDDAVVPLRSVQLDSHERGGGEGAGASRNSLIRYLPHGEQAREAGEQFVRLQQDAGLRNSLAIPLDEAQLLAPIEAPPKILLLAGNYVEHLLEEGLMATERTETFPYVFMKPLSTLHAPGAPITIPAASPEHTDYEGELGVIIGRQARAVAEADALDYVAGYTVVNDVSDRKYRPNPERKPREKDVFFDWLHGKWHDGFCPLGPCLTAATAIPDPQSLALETRVNGEVRQQAGTAQMIFPVAGILAFLSQWMTLEPGDLIVTGTPAGVGMSTGTYLRHGDVVEVEIEGIGTLRNAFQQP